MTDHAWVSDFFAAVDRQDWEAVGTRLAPDVTIEAPGFTGATPAAVSGWMSVFFAAFPDLSHRPSGVFGGNGRIGMEVAVKGTHTADLATPAGAVPPTGKAIDLSLGEFWDVDDAGLITRYRVYFDQLEFLTQIGLAGS